MIVFQHVAWPTWPACTAVEPLFLNVGSFPSPSFFFFCSKKLQRGEVTVF